MDSFRRNNLNNNRLNEYKSRVNNSTGNFNAGIDDSKKYDKNINMNNNNNNMKFTMRNGFITMKPKNKI